MASTLPNTKILFAHGFAGGAYQFDYLADELAKLGIQSERVPFAGHDGRPDDGSLRLRKHAGFAAEIASRARALRQTGAARVLAVGHSQGAAATQIAAADAGADAPFDGMVLVAPTLMGGVTPAANRAMRRRPVRYLWALLRKKPFRLHPDDLRSLYFNGDVSGWADAWIEKMAAQAGSSAAVLESLKMRLDGHPADVPTQIVTASYDRLLDTEAQKAWAEHRGIPCHPVIGSHMSVLRQPALLGIIERAARAIG
jgi:pimeloyl-ACP methyl ester carboxylesterase